MASLDMVKKWVTVCTKPSLILIFCKQTKDLGDYKNSTPCLSANQTIPLPQQKFPKRLISKEEITDTPLRSPVLTPPNFFVKLRVIENQGVRQQSTYH